jgi:hypothetical protein
MLRFILIAFSCFLGFLATHVFVFRTIEVLEPAKTVFTIFFIFFFVYCFIWLIYYFMIRRSRPDSTVLRNLRLFAINGLVIYVFLFMGYLEFYFTVDRSITTRIMILVERSPDWKLTYEQAKEMYDLETIFKRRFDDMVYGGYMTENNGYYENTKKGSLVARIYEFSRRLLRFED